MPVKQQKDIGMVLRLRRDYGLHLIITNSEYEKLMERQSKRFMNQFLKYNKNKDTILQNLNNCIKLFNINEQSIDLGSSQLPEQQTSQEEFESQNQNEEGEPNYNNQQEN